jgi:hypothetical protein
MMKVPGHVYVLGYTYTCHTYCCYVLLYLFTRIGYTLLTCDMYKSSLRHIHDPVLSSLKMEGIRFFYVISIKCSSGGIRNQRNLQYAMRELNK